MNVEDIKTIEDVLEFKFTVTTGKPVQGMWDGGVKSEFEFTPSLTWKNTAVRWGCYAANLWVIIPFKTGKQHFNTLRRKLRTSVYSRSQISEVSIIKAALCQDAVCVTQSSVNSETL